jgi:hypothetical protein
MRLKSLASGLALTAWAVSAQAQGHYNDYLQITPSIDMQLLDAFRAPTGTVLLFDRENVPDRASDSYVYFCPQQNQNKSIDITDCFALATAGHVSRNADDRLEQVMLGIYRDAGEGQVIVQGTRIHGYTAACTVGNQTHIRPMHPEDVQDLNDQLKDKRFFRMPSLYMLQGVFKISDSEGDAQHLVILSPYAAGTRSAMPVAFIGKGKDIAETPVRMIGDSSPVWESNYFLPGIGALNTYLDGSDNPKAYFNGREIEPMPEEEYNQLWDNLDGFNLVRNAPLIQPCTGTMPVHVPGRSVRP